MGSNSFDLSPVTNQLGKGINFLTQLQGQEDAIWSQKQFAGFREESFKSELEAQESAELGATGFTEQRIADHDEKVKAAIAEAPTQNARNRLQLQLDNYKVGLSNRSAAFEIQSKAGKVKLDAADTLQKNAAWVVNNPSDKSMIDQDINGFIDELALPALQKQELKRGWKEDSAVAWFNGSLNEIEREYTKGNLSMEDAQARYDEVEKGLDAVGFDVSQGSLIKMKNIFNTKRSSFKTQAISNLTAQVNALEGDDNASMAINGKHVPGYEKMVEELVAAKGGVQGALLQKKFEINEFANNSVFIMNESLKVLDIAGATKVIQDLGDKVTAGGAGTDKFAAALGKTQRAFAQKLENIAADPFAATLAVGSVKHAENLQQRVLNSVALQKDLVGERFVKVLGVNERDNIIRQLSVAKTDEYEQIVNQLREQYNFPLPDGRRAYEVALGQLTDESIDNNLSDFNNILVNHSGEVYFNNLKEAALLDMDELKSSLAIRLGADDKERNDSFKLLQRKTNEKMRDFQNAVAGIHSLEKVNGMADATLKYAMYLMSKEGVQEDKAINKAYNDLFGRHLDLVSNDTDPNKKILIPKQVGGTMLDAKNINDKLNAFHTRSVISEHLDKYEPDLAGFNPRMSDRFAKLKTRASLQEYTFWQTSPDSTGVTLWVDLGDEGETELRFMIDGKSTPITEKFSDLDATLFRQRPTSGGGFRGTPGATQAELAAAGERFRKKLAENKAKKK